VTQNYFLNTLHHSHADQTGHAITFKKYFNIYIVWLLTIAKNILDTPTYHISRKDIRTWSHHLRVPSTDQLFVFKSECDISHRIY